MRLSRSLSEPATDTVYGQFTMDLVSSTLHFHFQIFQGEEAISYGDKRLMNFQSCQIVWSFCHQDQFCMMRLNCRSHWNPGKFQLEIETFKLVKV